MFYITKLKIAIYNDIYRILQNGSILFLLKKEVSRRVISTSIKFSLKTTKTTKRQHYDL